MYQCKHFQLQELIPPHVYDERAEKAWQLLDDRALITLDSLRDRFGFTTVNNWHIGGNYKWRGLRTPECPEFSPYSQHTFGRGFDCVFSGTSAEEARSYILSRKEEFPFIRSMEKGVSWLHFDVRNCLPIFLFDK